MRIDSDLEQECNDLDITLWKKPIAPVRRPIRGADGQLVLDFASEPARQKFKQTCISQVTANCIAGSRSGCYAKAMDKCRGPRWLRWLGWQTNKPWSEIEACEDQYMEACIAASTKACQAHAEGFCEVVVAPKESG